MNVEFFLEAIDTLGILRNDVIIKAKNLHSTFWNLAMLCLD